MKATKDFQYANQVFEVQLENAEWLETKQDGDTLYIEDNTYVANDAKDPIEFLPGGTSSSTGDGSTETTDVLTATTNYKNALASLLKAKQAYVDVLTENKDNMAAYDAAMTKVNAAQEALDDAAQELKDAQEAAKNSKEAYEEALAGNGATSSVNISKVYAARHAYLSYLEKLYDGQTIEDGMYGNVTVDDIDNITEITVNAVSGGEYYDKFGDKQEENLTAPVGSPFKKAAMTPSDFTSGGASATDGTGAFYSVGNGVLKHYQVAADQTIAKETVDTLTGQTPGTTLADVVIGATPIDITIVAAGAAIDASNFKITASVAEAELENLIDDGVVELVDAADGLEEKWEDLETAAAAVVKQETDEEYKTAVTKAAEEAAAAAGQTSAEDLQKLKEKMDNDAAYAQKVEEGIPALEKAVTDAQAEADKVAPANVSTAEKAYTDAQTARINAGTTLFGARVNVGDQMTEANAFVTGLDPKAGSTDETLLKQKSVTGITSTALKDDTVSDWEKEFNGTAVAANVDIAVGSQTLHIKVTKKTNSTIIVETDGYKLQKDDEIRLPLFVRT